MDDPSHRVPPYPPGAIVPVHPQPMAPHPHVHVVQGLPGMPLPPMPGVSVQISNVVGPPPVIYPQQPHPYAPAHPPGQPGVVDMMRNDASQRAMEAVARRGPARVLAMVVGVGSSVMALGVLSMLLLGASVGPVLFAALPLTLLALVAFVFAARAGRGVASHHLEQSILELAARNRGVVRVVALAQHTGRPLRECQTAIDAMVHAGHATVEADEQGALLYRIPDLEPRREVVVMTERL